MEKITKPITPQEALAKHEKSIHPGLIEIINEILIKKFASKGDSVTIKSKEIVSEFKKRFPDFPEDKLYDEKHMDFEDLYRKSGWNVKYDQPAYCETYDSYYEFSAKKRK